MNLKKRINRRSFIDIGIYIGIIISSNIVTNEIIKRTVPKAVLEDISKFIGMPIVKALIDTENVVNRIYDPLFEPDLERKLEQKYGITIIGRTNNQNLAELASSLETLEKNWDMFPHYISTANLILIDPLGPLYQYLSLSLKFGGAAIEYNRSILLNFITPKIVIHELAHSYHLSLPKKREFDQRWKELNPNYFAGVDEKFLSISEDVASVIDTLFLEKLECLESKISPCRVLLRPMLAHEGTFKLLAEYGFISHKEASFFEADFVRMY